MGDQTSTQGNPALAATKDLECQCGCGNCDEKEEKVGCGEGCICQQNEEVSV